MTKPINTAGIEKATNKSWQEWLKILDNMGAKDLSHKEIARQLYDELDGKVENHGWWAQGITVAYEQQIGRRVPGQRSDGSFEVSVNKTLNGSMDEAFGAWLELLDQQTDFNGVKLIGEASTSETVKWRNWRATLVDGTKVVVGINQKTPDKANLGLAHQKLHNSGQAEAWRMFWKEFLNQLGQELH